MFKRICATLTAGFVAAAFTCSHASAGSLTIQGSSTVANNVMIPHKAAIEAASGVTYDVITNGSSHGLLAVAEGRAPLGMISAELSVQIGKVSQNNPGKLDGKDLRAYPIGETQVSFIVHPSNPVNAVTLEKVGAILRGEIKNWKELGGADTPIVVVAELKGGGIRSMVEDDLLKKAGIKAQLREVPGAPQIGKVVAQLPSALGLSTPASHSDGVTGLDTGAVLKQPLILVTLGEPGPDAAKLIEAAVAVMKAGS